MSSFRFGSHLPVLIKAVEKTKGPILELGSGFNSTIFLHWACYHAKRKLVTLESSRRYLRESQLKKFNCEWHTIKLVKDWATEDLSGDWSVAFVDQSPGHARGFAIKQLTDAEYVVAHDTLCSDSYGYEEIYDLFKYRFDFIPGGILYPTSVLSNKHDLKGFME